MQAQPHSSRKGKTIQLKGQGSLTRTHNIIAVFQDLALGSKASTLLNHFLFIQPLLVNEAD